MNDKRRNFHATFTISTILLAAIAVFLISVLGNLTGARLDLTEDRLFTMSPAAVRILSELKVPVQVRLFISPSSRMPTEFKNLERDITEQIRNYERISNGMLQFSVHNPQDDEDMQQDLNQKGIQPFQVQSVEKDEIGVRLIWSGLSIAYMDKPEEIIPRLLPQSLPNLETLIIAPVHRLTRERNPKVALFAPKQEVDPQVAMMYMQQGMQPPQPQERFSLVKQLLEQEHYQVQETLLSQDSPIAADADVLMIMGPQNLEPRQAWEINRVLSNGLPVLMAVQSNEYSYQPGPRGGWTISGTSTPSGLEDMLAGLGLQVVQDHFLDLNSQMLDLPREVNLGGLRMQVREPVETPVQIRITQDQVNREQPVTNHIGQLLYLWGTPIELDRDKLAALELQSETLFTSSRRSWRAAFGGGMLTATQTDPSGKQMLDPQPLAVLVEGQFPDVLADGGPPAWPSAENDPGTDGNSRDSLDMAAEQEVTPLTPNPGQLMLFGCAKMFDDMVLQGAQNALLLLNSVDFLSGSRDLLTIRSKQLTQRTIRPVAAGEKIVWQFFTIALMPIVFIAVGVFRSARRRAEAARWRRELHGGA
jgi:ABC-2 type transport system permease protein